MRNCFSNSEEVPTFSATGRTGKVHRHLLSSLMQYLPLGNAKEHSSLYSQVTKGLQDLEFYQ